MQKRSKGLEIQFAPVSLDPQLPICGGEPFEQADHPITYLHFHPCLELGYCYAGSGVFAIGEKILPFKAGDVSFINPTEVHLARSTPGSRSQWAWVFLDPLRMVPLPAGEAKVLDPAMLAGASFNNLIPGERFPAIARNVLRLIEELRARRADAAPALRALTWELMVLVQRHAPELGAATAPPLGDYRRLAPALAFIAKNYAAPIAIGPLARRCGLSEPHFRRLFGRTMSRSPAAYWHDLRLRMASSLLCTTDLSVLEISQTVGYSTLSSFNRQFSAAFSCAPRAWRRRGVE